MLNRADGYPIDVDFPAFFYKEMPPVWLACVSRLLGFAAPDVAGPFTYCEAGCGLGINLLVAAACHPAARFVGVDVNDRPLRIARAAAQAAGLQNIEFVHSGFDEFAGGRPGSFDFIATHGVWSWVVPRHRDALLALVEAGLKPGGLFYLHYMCHPGSTDLLTIQHFLHLFARQVPGTSARQVQTGLKLLGQLAGRGLFVDRPGVLRHLDNLGSRDPDQLAHEFLTDHWQPQHSVDVHQQLGAVGLSYLGSADVFNNLDVALSIPGQLQGVIRQTGEPALAETLKDLARNSHQRMDLFQREPRPLSPQAYGEQLGSTVFHAVPGAPVGGPLTFTTPIGPVEAPPVPCNALLQRLATGPAPFAELARLPAFAGQPALLLQTLQLMLMQAIVHPANPTNPADLTSPADRANPAEPAAAAGNRQATALTRWLARNRLSLKVIEACGTAVPIDAPSVADRTVIHAPA